MIYISKYLPVDSYSAKGKNTGHNGHYLHVFIPFTHAIAKVVWQLQVFD